MDENLGYGGDDDERRVSSQWNLMHESLESLEHESSKQFLQYQNYHLYLIQKKEPPLERRIIPASRHERLSYFRNYVSSPNKTQTACMHPKTFNSFFWEYIINTSLKSLQHTYVNTFLASYVPEEHLFLSKMMPIMYGLKFCFIITAFLEVVSYVLGNTLLFDYLIGSIFLKNPWNRCPKSGLFIHKSGEVNRTINCYNVLDFGNRVKNKTITFYHQYYYIHEDAEILQLVQIEYFRFRITTISVPMFLLYSSIICSLISFCHNQIFKQNFWKFYNIVHWCVIAMDITSFVYLTIDHFFKDFESEVQSINSLPSQVTEAFLVSDINFLAESTTAPPVVHVLTARSTQEISPGRDSAVIVVSNAVCFLFRALLSYKVKQHCESLVRVPILMPYYATNAAMFFWPMYFSTFFLGDIYTLLFIMFHFTMEIMTAVVTFQCLVEVIVTEWPKTTSWLISAIMLVVIVLFTNTVPVSFGLVLAYNKSTATLLECIVLYFMYPVYRLVDDISFHYGTPPHFVRVQMLVIVPFYYLWKYYGLMSSTIKNILPTHYKSFIVHALVWAFSLMILPLLLGSTYIIYMHIVKARRSWSSMFNPAEDWGPRDYNTRQLRKDYDSRTYNSSQAHRNLSRYIIGRAESKAYRLDIRYESNRRSTIANFEMKTENEKNA